MISGFHDSFHFSDVQGPASWPKGCMSLARVVQRRSAHDNLDSSHGSPLPRFVVLAVQSYQEACGSCSAGTTTNSIRRSGLATMAQAPSMKDSCAMAQVQVQPPQGVWYLSRYTGIFSDSASSLSRDSSFFLQRAIVRPVPSDESSSYQFGFFHRSCIDRTGSGKAGGWNRWMLEERE